jgi:hypothetical protein
MPTNNLPTSNDAPAGGLSSISKGAGRMSEYEIVEGDIKKFKIDMDPKKAYAALIKMTKQPNYRVVRHNDSLLFVDNHQDGTADGIMFTMDKPQAFVQSLMQFNAGLKNAKLHKLTITSDFPHIETFLKKAHLNYTISENKGHQTIVVTA